MSVVVETRTKRNLSKTTINTKNDKIKKKLTFNNKSTFVNEVDNDEVEYDCCIKIKETNNYKSEREFVNMVKESNFNYFECCPVEVCVNDVLKRMTDMMCCIVDSRDCRMYQNGHINGALLFNCQKRMMVMKAKKSWDMFDDKCNYDSVIVYNQRGEYTAHFNEFMDHIKKDFNDVVLIKGGYEEFLRCGDKKYITSAIAEDIYDQYHYSPTNESTKSTDVLNATISEITPFLYLGNEIDSKDLEILKKKKITHILNVTTNVPFANESLFKCKRLSATDCNKQDMRAHYNDAFRFIDEAISQKGKVLVHCWAGVSRSATIVAAYILNHTRLSVLQTIAFLQSKRSIVEPNFNFLGQLERYYCDLEKGVESRSEVYFKDIEDAARKVADLERVKDLSLSSESSCSPVSPIPPKPYFNFIK